MITPPSKKDLTMVEVTILVITPADGENATELATLRLQGVPRVGEILIAQNAEFVVKEVCWSENVIE